MLDWLAPTLFVWKLQLPSCLLLSGLLRIFFEYDSTPPALK
ncbi:hypothetical protein STRDD11_00804 [Streptococcus sp. DD11]|nr:hypothetical protein STRDD11_00804 [Streptococcus sp. DD11]